VANGEIRDGGGNVGKKKGRNREKMKTPKKKKTRSSECKRKKKGLQRSSSIKSWFTDRKVLDTGRRESGNNGGGGES